jgi:hypothetical protein
VKKFLKHNGFLFLIATAVIVVDQLTKALVRQNLALGEAWAPIPAIENSFVFCTGKTAVPRLEAFKRGSGFNCCENLDCNIYHCFLSKN